MPTRSVNLGFPIPSVGDSTYPASVTTAMTTLDAQNALGALAVQTLESPSATLNVKITGGVFRKSDGTAVTYAGAASFAVTSNNTSYLYLTDAGVLTMNTTGFPAGNIVPLATVVAGVSSITSVTDSRQLYSSFGANANTVYLPLVGGAGSPMAGPIYCGGTGNLAGVVFQAATPPPAPVEGQTYNDANQKTLGSFVGGQTQRLSTCVYAASGVVNQNNFTGPLQLTPASGVGSQTIAANMLAVGKTIRVRAKGFVSSTGTVNLTLSINIGSVVASTTGAVSTTGLANAGFSIDADLSVRAIGSGTSANVYAQGIAFIAATAAPMVSTAVSAGFDSTATQVVGVFATWGASAAGNTITLTNLTIEILD